MPHLQDAPFDRPAAAAVREMHPISRDPNIARTRAYQVATDLTEAMAASASERRMCWAILVAARGGFCRQYKILEDQQRRGLA